MISFRHDSTLLGVANASALTLLACGIQWLLWPHMPPMLWLFFYPSVYLSSWIWGVAGGLTSATLSVGLVWLLFVPPGNPFNNGVLPTAVFLVMSALFVLVHERLNQARRRLEVLFSQSADAIVVVARNGQCQAVNVAACRLLALDQPALLASSFFDWVASEDLERAHRTLHKLEQGHRERMELVLRLRQGERVPVELSINLLPDGHWLVSLRDISQRKAAESTLQQVRSELLEAQRLAKIGSWRWVLKDERPEWSPEMYRIYALEPGQPAPTVAELENMFTPASRQASEQALKEALGTGRPYEAERELRLPSGQSQWVRITVEGVRDADGSIYAFRGTAQDITEHKRAELALLQSRRELRDMAAHREQEREQERKAIAREIHDELGQLLAAMRMDVAQLRQEAGTSEHAQAVVSDLNMLVGRTFEVVRSLATSLRPPALDLGLTAALRWLVEDFSLRWEIPCELRVSGAERELDDMHATAIFRIVQESLTNIAKHAHASQVEVAMTYSPESVQVTVQDDGRGFDPASLAQRRNRFGLLGMRERVLALHGQIDVTRRAEGGTRVSIAVPMSPDSTLPT